MFFTLNLESFLSVSSNFKVCSPFLLSFESLHLLCFYLLTRCWTGSCSNSFVTLDFSECSECSFHMGKIKFPLSWLLPTAEYLLSVVHQWAFLHSPAAGQPSQCRRRNEGWCGFVWVFFSLCCSMKCGIHLFTNISISVVGAAGLTCKWQRVTWSKPHISHNSSRRLVKTWKQEVGRAYLIFTSHSEA